MMCQQFTHCETKLLSYHTGKYELKYPVSDKPYNVFEVCAQNHDGSIQLTT